MENLYLKYGDKRQCNGCGACQYICPVNAIKMVKDEEGFEYPHIDESKCIHCDKCKKYCSNFNQHTSKSITYRGINKNTDDLAISSSGGIFLAFAKKIIEQNGVVFGVKYDKKLKVIHDYAETLEGIKEFCGSKYVRSDIQNSYRQVKQFLQEGRKVLFTGTSCQVQGLNVFLKQEYDNLVTMDIICHANPSPKVFELYVEEIQKSRNKTIKNIAFRSKAEGWRNQNPVIEYTDGSKEIEKTFMKAFLKECINRPSCYSCPFASQSRISDITIGDFWGVEKIEPELNEKLGISIFMVNTEKAQKELKQIEDTIDLKRVDFDQIKGYNHFNNVPESLKRKKFFQKMNKGVNILDLMKKVNHDTITYRIINKIRNTIRKKVKK